MVVQYHVNILHMVMLIFVFIVFLRVHVWIHSYTLSLSLVSILNNVYNNIVAKRREKIKVVQQNVCRKKRPREVSWP